MLAAMAASPEPGQALARRLAAMLQFIVQSLPEGDPVVADAQAVTRLVSLTEPLAFGQWTAEQELALSEARRQLADSATQDGLDAPTIAIARLIAAVQAGDRLLIAARGQEPGDRPSPAQLDAAITEIEATAAAIEHSPFPREPMASGARLRIARLLLERVHLQGRAGLLRDQPSIDAALHVLYRSREILASRVPALASQAQPLLASVTADIATLEAARATGTLLEFTPHARPTGTAPTGGPGSGPAPGPAADGRADLGSPADQHSLQDVLEGMRFVARFLPDDHELRPPLQAMVVMADAALEPVTGRVAGSDEALADIERIASDDTRDPGERAGLRFSLAVAHGNRVMAGMYSASPDDWPATAAVSQAIAALEEAADAAEDTSPEAMGVALGLAAALLARLAAREADGGDWTRDPGVRATTRARLARARGHLARIPPGMPSTDNLAGRLAADIDRAERLLATVDVDSGTDGRDGPGRGDPVRANPADATSLSVASAMAAANRARASGDLADLGQAIGDLRTITGRLEAGDPARAPVLTTLASLLQDRADRTGAGDDLMAATDAAISAVNAAPPQTVKYPAALLAQLLGRLGSHGHLTGPFRPAEEALSRALATVPPGDTESAMALNFGIGAARLMGAISSGDEQLRGAALAALTTAEDLLGEPQPTLEWFAPSLQLLGWAMSSALMGTDAATVDLANRVAGRLEALLARHPEFAGQLARRDWPSPAPLLPAADGHPVLRAIQVMRGMIAQLSGDSFIAQVFRANPEVARNIRMTAARASSFPFIAPTGQETRRLAAHGLEIATSALREDHQDPGLLRAACADLRAALSGGLDDDSLRHEVNAALGACLARLHWLGEPDPAVGPPGLATLLAGAIHYLELALADSEHSAPTPRRAGLLDLLARCYRESARTGQRRDGKHQAEQAVYAALRELARCVLTAPDTDKGIRIAARSSEIVARTVGWCLDDERPAAAIAIAEAGRGLVLASTVLAGRVTDVLRAAGEHDAAGAWGRGDQEGRLAGLNAVWRTQIGGSLLRTPDATEITAALRVATDADAVVYLVPPAAGTRGDAWPLAGIAQPARALVCRAGIGQVDVLGLPEMNVGPGNPLDAYLAAFEAALTAPGPCRLAPGDDAGVAVERDPGEPGNAGHAWLRALDELGAWAHDHIIGPLAGHVATWGLRRAPRLVIVPLGKLAAIPYAGAWTRDASLPGGRRYAVHDLVLSYAVSGRFLSDIAQRPRRPLWERIVLASAGDFPFARKAAAALASGLYPGAELYGRASAPSGLASTDRILAALPGTSRSGASLLHLATHASSEPVAQFRTADGWLPLSRILDEARDRPATEPGGLVISNACLTDSTRAHYDESVTLATALLAAGATGVIGTRWPIYDDASAALTYYLHHHLAHGHRPADALRLAQLDLLAPEPPRLAGQPPFMGAIGYRRRAHPASWAGYTYHGV
jgi:hypothetical protein